MLQPDRRILYTIIALKFRSTHISENETDTGTPTPERPSRHRRLRKWLRGIVISLLVTVAVLVIAVTAFTLYLTPANLTSLINREASDYFMADIRAHNVRFTLWKTFPHLYLEFDSLSIRSRTLDSIDPALKRKLPADAPALASCGKFLGSINLVKLIGGKIFLKDVTIHDLSLNMVAVNDSVNNYNIIPPTTDAPTPLPYFTADRIRLINSRPLRFFSLATNTRAVATFQQAWLTGSATDRNTYSIMLRGNLRGNVNGLEVLSQFPFELTGKTELNFNPFRVKFSNLAINLGNTRGHLDMSLTLGQEMKINRLIYHVDSFDIMKFLSYLPGNIYPYISGVNADINIIASAMLTAPYSFSASRLPSFEISFRAPDGTISYTVSNRETYTLGYSGVRAEFVFNGDNAEESYFALSNLQLHDKGTDVGVRARMTGLMSTPHVRGEITAVSDLGKAGQVRFMRPYRPQGLFETKATVDFDINSLTEPTIHNVHIFGNATLQDFAFLCGTPEMTMSADNLSLYYDGRAERVQNADLLSSHITADLDVDRICFLSPGATLTLRGLTLSVGGATRLIPADITSTGIPYTATLQASSVKADIPADSLHILLKGFSVKGSATARKYFDIGSSAKGLFAARETYIKHPSASGAVSGLTVTFAMAPLKKDALRPASPTDFHDNDSAQLQTLRHTPAYLALSAPPEIAQFINSWHLRAAAKASAGKVRLPAYGDSVAFGNMNIACTPDSANISSLTVSTAGTTARLTASASNLRQALTYPVACPLPLKLDLDIDTVNINSLAHSYGGNSTSPKTTVLSAEQAEADSLANSLALLIPRNIEASVNARAKETVYTNLHLYDLSTAIKLSGGRADIRDLRIYSDFGHASLDFTYDTHDMLNLSMAANLGVKDINVVNFFKNFHTLLLMMPQMKNLSGFISAECKGKMQIFPDMYINIPSLWADMAVQGRHLKLHQNHFIRRITKMMLIPNADDIYIKNMDVRATIHDNLLELYPFNFEFSKYKLRMEGLNNFDGKLFYHIGVLDSPLHVPFGINIKGWFHDPQLSFGGAHYNDKNGIHITSQIMEENRMNLIKELKYYLKEFVEKAAEAAVDPSLSL